MSRNLNYFNNNRIVYRRDPITDKPDQENEVYMFYLNGTYECYHLFASKAKITTFKSLKWHLLVLWYLNPQLDQDQFMRVAEILTDKRNGFTSFKIHEDLMRKIVYEVSMLDLDEPPKNKLRKVIFKYGNQMCKEEKLRVVGRLIGRLKSVTAGDIYDLMLSINDSGRKITIRRLATHLNCTTRTIHRNMGEELKREKELLNKENEKINI